MAHFAELDKNNIVLRVITVNNEDCLDENGNESEAVGIAFCKNLLGGNWIQTSYNSAFRKNYAGVGYKYDKKKDIFIPVKPFDSWVLNDDYIWVAPVDYPTDENRYLWDEELKNWVAAPTGE